MTPDHFAQRAPNSDTLAADPRGKGSGFGELFSKGFQSWPRKASRGRDE